jgi:hypothetical protein
MDIDVSHVKIERKIIGEDQLKLQPLDLATITT